MKYFLVLTLAIFTFGCEDDSSKSSSQISEESKTAIYEFGSLDFALQSRGDNKTYDDDPVIQGLLDQLLTCIPERTNSTVTLVGEDCPVNFSSTSDTSSEKSLYSLKHNTSVSFNTTEYNAQKYFDYRTNPSTGDITYLSIDTQNKFSHILYGLFDLNLFISAQLLPNNRINSSIKFALKSYQFDENIAASIQARGYQQGDEVIIEQMNCQLNGNPIDCNELAKALGIDTIPTLNPEIQIDQINKLLTVQ